VSDLSDYACHPCAILSGDTIAVFAKYSETPGAARQFEIERASLRYLAERTGVLVPTPIGVVPALKGMLFITEAVKAVERGPPEWREIGRTLARIHRVEGENFGFHMDNFFGPLEQENTPAPDWVTFYRDRRLIPRLQKAVDSGSLPHPLILQMEKVIQRLPELCGPETRPVLLHGDAQQNNFISTAQGVYVIDPAIHYGNPELDLAFIDYFQPASEEFFEGYREERPIDAGFAERRDLWRISGYLAAVAVEGAAYLDRLAGAMKRYL
jgi:fructosamine-3-kinase